MKKKLFNLLCCVIVVLLTLGTALFMGHFLDPLGTGDSINSIKAFHMLPENSVDVMMFGTSHTWKGCDTNVLYDEYGISAYNYGGNWQAFNTTFLFMEDAFRTQKPKVVCIDTYVVDSYLQDVDMDGQIYYTRAISNFPGKKRFLKDCFGNRLGRYVSYYFPISVFHDNWTCITKENFYDARTKEDYLSTRGYEPLEGTRSFILDDYKTFKKSALSEKAVSLLDEVVELCRENGTEVIFYTAPYYGEYEYFDAMKEYASKHDCAYLNLFELVDEMGFDPMTDFSDSQHVNTSGARKIGLFLGKYIRENYDIPDCRN